MNIRFIGRHQELAELNKLFKKKAASLVVVQGRRRIGKSRLIEEFAKNNTFYTFSGLVPTEFTTLQSQLDEFSRQLSFQTGLPEIKANDWSKLFLLLAEKLRKGKIIVLFDEISWMGSKDPDFLGKLKNAWDLYFKKNPELIFVLCGSASVWIEENILSSTGFLGRISYRLTLDELSLSECNQFWPKAGGRISAYEKLKVLSVTGGIPRYLEEIKPSLSSEENIKDLCFMKGSPLVNEFNEVFSDLFFKKNATYKKIVQTLSERSLEIKEICEGLSVKRTGFMSKCLEDLIKSGFLTRDYTWQLKSGTPSKLSHYRLSDNYLRFYLKYIDKNVEKIKSNEYIFKTLGSLVNFETIMGFQFENLVLKNRTFIKKILGISLDDVVSDNPFFQRKTARLPGCQIDYLIQTKFNHFYLCEIKFSKREINASVISELEKKIKNFHYPKGYSCRAVLIHVNGVTEEVKNGGYFSDIIDFSQLLNGSAVI